MPSTEFSSLKTDRLVLRPFTVEDPPVLFNIVQEPDIFQYFPTRTAWPLEKVERYIHHQLGHWEKFGYGHWAVTLSESSQLMGWCGLEFLPDTNETEVGYLLSGEYWGKGYATEAASASVKFGMNESGLKEIIGLTDPLNIASQRVLEKSGLTFTRRQVYFGMEMFRFAIQA
ncbi:MAG: GNAT family N-acetyltransferase [Anaerolineales bacterium]|nr:GNAT family N-acetyltransferase [Anaerolineales bacterium]